MDQLVCQKCRTPLRLDDSLEDLNPASFKILADAAPVLEPEAPGLPTSAAFQERLQRYHDIVAGLDGEHDQASRTPVKRTAGGADMSYVMLSEPQPSKEKLIGVKKTKSKKEDSKLPDENVPLSDQFETRLRLFEILSSRSDIDHPICTDCAEVLLQSMQARQSSTIRERDAYVHFLKQAQEDIPTDEEKARSHRHLLDTERRERQALEELEALEAEKARMEDELAALHAESERLDEEEEVFWQQRNALTAELTSYREERDSLRNQLAHDNKLLESLQRSNVYNDIFCIGHDGNFGTISSLRLGKLADHQVDWTEINAAWGQALLLLAVVGERLGYTFNGWKLHPMGSTSRIEKIETLQSTSTAQAKQKGAMLELFSTGDVPLSFGFLHRSFDSGMVAFLDCLRQLGEHVERTTSGLRMPYKIVKDKIGDISIKFGNFGQEGDWTKACKFTLTCCKFLLAHASHIDDPRNTKHTQ